jgi:hypothetical protein
MKKKGKKHCQTHSRKQVLQSSQNWTMTQHKKRITGNANPNHANILPHSRSRTETTTNVKDVGKKEPSYTADENVN